MHEKPNLCYSTTTIPYSKRKIKYRMTILYRKAPSVFFGRSNHIFQYIKIQLKKTKFKLALSGKKASNNTKKKKKKKALSVPSELPHHIQWWILRPESEKSLPERN